MRQSAFAAHAPEGEVECEQVTSDTQGQPVHVDTRGDGPGCSNSGEGCAVANLIATGKWAVVWTVICYTLTEYGRKIDAFADAFRLVSESSGGALPLPLHKCSHHQISYSYSRDRQYLPAVPRLRRVTSARTLINAKTALGSVDGRRVGGRRGAGVTVPTAGGGGALGPSGASPVLRASPACRDAVYPESTARRMTDYVSMKNMDYEDRSLVWNSEQERDPKQEQSWNRNREQDRGRDWTRVAPGSNPSGIGMKVVAESESRARPVFYLDLR
ncbi:hypothetical protein EVAR_93956_1 [Eumeta japonica]|uniref:Uncharacterized protein n=1 Tax=Eumeta variegata TaxID=151549 RepID=A0A4C1TP90_EUMVA|nr:hypothetical protein EVAR_93956_1 [Eumeta japonica]